MFRSDVQSKSVDRSSFVVVKTITLLYPIKKQVYVRGKLQVKLVYIVTAYLFGNTV